MPKHKAFGLLEILLVVAVLAILMGGYFTYDRSVQQSASTYQMSMQRSNNAACLANRSALRSQAQMFQINNPSTPLTIENLRAAGMSVPGCPRGGEYQFLPDGNIHCSLHDGPLEPDGQTEPDGQ